MSGTGSVLLDTTAVIAHLRQESGLTRQFGDKGLYLPVIALGELFYGAYRSRVREKVVAQIQDFLQLCAVLLPGQVTPQRYGEIKAELAQAGEPIPENDAWIAALAREHGLSLLTRDAHFSAVRGLTVVGW